MSNSTPRIVQLMLVVFDGGSSDGERLSAIRAIQRQLKNDGSDSHELVGRLGASPIDETEMQKIFNAGYQQRCADEAEQRRQAMVAVTSPFADGDVGEGLNGYSWLEIVGHCSANKERIHNNWESHFIKDLAERWRSSRYTEPTAKQAPYVRQIFMRWFGGRI